MLPENVKQEIKLFENPEFGKVRVLIRDGEPWFVANDVAAALGYSIPKDAVSAHCNYVELLKGGDSQPFTDSPRGINIIPESDVYALIFRSNLPTAIQFRQWVCEKVLPEIRKTGSYSLQKVELLDFTNPVEAARAWADEYEAKMKALEENKILTEDNEYLREEVGNATYWKQVKAIDWLPNYYDVSIPNVYRKIGKHLSALSRVMNEEIRKAQDSTYGTVNVYSVKIIELFKQQTMTTNIFAEYRKS
ncbi:MAG: hypothetical protein HDQ88_09570 [Clostridia bacterium]|nr:hypothetical protein [Clostridia bacterium]